MNRTTGIIVLVIIVLAGLAWYFWGSAAPATQTPAPAAVATTTSTEQPPANPQSSNVTVTYTDQGFSPALVTIPEGATVTFVNHSTDEMWVASNPHPTHQGYDDTTERTHCAPGYTGTAPFDECAAVMTGGSYSFTFTKVGTWGYHNHGNASDGGTVVVTAPTSASAGVNVNVQ